MSEENAGNDKTKEEKDALSRMIENDQVIGINGDNKPIDFASHKRVVLVSDNSYVLVDPHRAKMAIEDSDGGAASIKVFEKTGASNEETFPEINLNVKNNSRISVRESGIKLEVQEKHTPRNPSRIEIDDEWILFKADGSVIRVFRDDEGCIEIFSGGKLSITMKEQKIKVQE